MTGPYWAADDYASYGAYINTVLTESINEYRDILNSVNFDLLSILYGRYLGMDMQIDFHSRVYNSFVWDKVTTK